MIVDTNNNPNLCKEMRQTDAWCVASAACSTTRAARPSCCSNPADAGVANRPRKDMLALDFNEWAGKLFFSHQLVPFPGKQGLICISSLEWTTKARFKFPRLRAVCSWQRDWHDRSLELHAHRSVPVCTETLGGQIKFGCPTNIGTVSLFTNRGEINAIL